MKITFNNTPYSTKDLMAICRRIAKDEFASPEIKHRKKNLHIEFRAAKSLRGLAYPADRFYQPRVEIFVPRKLVTPNHHHFESHEELRDLMAHVIAHEFLHIATHKSGPSMERHYRKTKRYGWVGTWADRFAGTREYWNERIGDLPLRLEVEVNPPKPKPTPVQKIDDELTRLDTRQANWESKARRAANALKKIEQRRKYLERRKAKLKGEG